ncbi:MAG: hypothetical protein ABI614_27325, partial [Planctomycetota bacterium]
FGKPPRQPASDLYVFQFDGEESLASGNSFTASAETIQCQKAKTVPAIFAAHRATPNSLNRLILRVENE